VSALSLPLYFISQHSLLVRSPVSCIPHSFFDISSFACVQFKCLIRRISSAARHVAQRKVCRNRKFGFWHR
jgi:hypothetical protein